MIEVVNTHMMIVTGSSSIRDHVSTDFLSNHFRTLTVMESNRYETNRTRPSAASVELVEIQ